MMVGDVCYVVFFRGYMKVGLMVVDFECCVEGMNNSELLWGLFYEFGDCDIKCLGFYFNLFFIYEGLLYIFVNVFY